MHTLTMVLNTVPLAMTTTLKRRRRITTILTMIATTRRNGIPIHIMLKHLSSTVITQRTTIWLAST